MIREDMASCRPTEKPTSFFGQQFGELQPVA